MPGAMSVCQPTWNFIYTDELGSLLLQNAHNLERWQRLVSAHEHVDA
jgi:hypothetical protein